MLARGNASGTRHRPWNGLGPTTESPGQAHISLNALAGRAGTDQSSCSADWCCSVAFSLAWLLQVIAAGSPLPTLNW